MYLNFGTKYLAPCIWILAPNLWHYVFSQVYEREMCGFLRTSGKFRHRYQDKIFRPPIEKRKKNDLWRRVRVLYAQVSEILSPTLFAWIRCILVPTPAPSFIFSTLPQVVSQNDSGNDWLWTFISSNAYLSGWQRYAWTLSQWDATSTAVEMGSAVHTRNSNTRKIDKHTLVCHGGEGHCVSLYAVYVV